MIVSGRFRDGIAGARNALRSVLAATFLSVTLGAAEVARPPMPVETRLTYMAQLYRAEFYFGIGTVGRAQIDDTKIHLVVTDDRRRIVLGTRQFNVVSVRELPPAANDTSADIEATFRADRSPPKPGMYTLSARFDPGVARNENVALPLNDKNEPARFYLDREPYRQAALIAGQRFLDAASNSTLIDTGTDPPLVDARGASVPREQIALHALTLEHIDTGVSPHELTFGVEGLGEVRMRSNADVMHLRGLVPLVEDREVQRLDRAYAGKSIWTIGSPTFFCVNAADTTAHAAFGYNKKFTIEHIFRAQGLRTRFPHVGETNDFDGPSVFETANPLVVALHPAPETESYGGQYPASMTDNSNAAFQRACIVFSTRYADSWDLERTLHLGSLEEEHPQWSAATRENIASGRVRVGMTHAMIAWMLGYPSVYGTAADLDRLDVWHRSRPRPARCLALQSTRTRRRNVLFLRRRRRCVRPATRTALTAPRL